MSSYRCADSKREEFRKYLETAGVMDVLTRVLVGLYEEPEKPCNAIDYLKQYLGADCPETADIEALKLEICDLQQQLACVTEENCCLKNKLAGYEQGLSAELPPPAEN